MYKNIKAILAAIVLAILVAGCGGGGGGAPTTAAVPAAAIAPQTPASTPVAQKISLPIKLAWRGDSINWGHSLDSLCATGQRCSPTPAQLEQNHLNTQFGAGVTLVVDQSAPGSTIKQDLTGTGYFAANEYGNGQPLATVLATTDQGYSLVINDSEINDQLVEGDTPDEFQTDVQNYITTVQAAGMVPIFVEPTAVAPTAINSPGENGTWIDATAYVTAEHAAAAMYGTAVAPMYSAWINYLDWNVVLLGADGVHPTSLGYTFRETQLASTIDAAVQKLLIQ